MGREQCIDNSPWIRDHLVSRETELEVDIESEGASGEENGMNDINLANNQGMKLLNTVWSGHLTFDASTSSSKFGDIGGENVELLLEKRFEEEEGHLQVASMKEKPVEEKHRKKNSRKAPKPPRPPNGPSLDAIDQKLVEEITELAMRKRARNERIKMLKKMRAAKSSSCKSSICAMVITILFCVIIVFQGICARNGRTMYHQEQPGPAVSANEDLITIEFFKDSAYKSDGSDSVSPNLAEGRVSGSRKAL